MEYKHVTFDSGADMVDRIRAGHDFYSPSRELYVFGYNIYGSICVYYHLAEEKAEELDAGDEYWGAYLSLPDSAIYDSEEIKEEDPDFRKDWDDFNDDALDWCSVFYGVGDWLDVSK